MKHSFFEKHLQQSFDLEVAFRRSCEHSWFPLVTINELVVQIGHVYSIFNKDLIESGRKLDNLGDEISDVILQLIILGRQLDFDFENYEYTNFDCSINDLNIILGQLTESVMECNGYRFNKPRVGFDTPQEFQHYKLTQLFNIIFSYCESIDIDIDKEYATMLDTANKWLNKNY